MERKILNVIALLFNHYWWIKFVVFWTRWFIKHQPSDVFWQVSDIHVRENKSIKSIHLHISFEKSDL